ncbi:hypothetical protein WJX73_001840 [Symbiochloris irregularis]|uniref:Histone-lysine N-methyltransferase ASHH2 n=1 Tax=Symbiochloris irregularis TaxID=706552 RepID=A0AAW1PIX3_9CHLO
MAQVELEEGPTAANTVVLPAAKLPPARDSWVQCDQCRQWRRVPKPLAESLDDDAPWSCTSNPDPEFADCRVPQEMSDDEIDRLIGCSEDAETEPGRWAAPKRPAVWQLVLDNIYTHRSRRKQDDDDIMICQCKPPKDGGPGCGTRCLNRILNLECTPEFCPCGDQCSNQMFSRRRYASLDKRRAGAKGFGLFTTQDLKAGQFIIEYVGEVLEEEEYVRRRSYYHDINQRHYYFMNIGNGEVIDACRKGALGRFINHSCAPNCETQKWLVHGELAIGLFALTDIPADSELTFDYNFERYGDKPLRCLCGSPVCRGFVGGTQENVKSREVHDPEDASLDLEPIMVGSTEVQDPLLAALLESEVGLIAEGWDAQAALARLKQLAAEKGIEVDWDAIRPSVLTSTSSGQASEHHHPVHDDHSHTPLAQAGPGSDCSRGNPQPPPSCTASFTLLPAAPQAPAREDEVTISPADSDSAADLVVLPNAPALAAASEGRGDTAAQAGPGHKPGREAPDETRGGKQAAAAASSIASSTSTATFTLPAKQTARDVLQPSLQALDGAQEVIILPDGFQAVHRRSEIDRKLDSLVTGKGRLRDASHSTIVKYLRLFNLCDFASGLQGAAMPASLDFAAARDHPAGMRPSDGSWSATFRGHGQDARPRSGRQHFVVEPTIRQRARMADLSLLLEVIVQTASSGVRRQMCECGLVRQLHLVLGHCEGSQHAVVLRKVTRVLEMLPLTADDMYTLTSAQGCLLDTLRVVATSAVLNADAEVKGRAAKLLLKYPLTACTGPALLPSGRRSRFGPPVIPPAPVAVPVAPPAAATAAVEAGKRPSPRQLNPDTPPKRPRPEHSVAAPHTSPRPRPASAGEGHLHRPALHHSAPPYHQASPSVSAWMAAAPTDVPGTAAMTHHAASRLQHQPHTHASNHTTPAQGHQGAGPQWSPSEAHTPRSRWDNGHHAAPGHMRGRAGLAQPSAQPQGQGQGQAATQLQRQSSDDLPSLDDEEQEDGDSPEEGEMVVVSTRPKQWAEPSAAFEAWVEKYVRTRIRKYCRPESSMNLNRQDVDKLQVKACQIIIEGERKAFSDRQRSSNPTPIELSKVEPRIKDYIKKKVESLRLRAKTAR